MNLNAGKKKNIDDYTSNWKGDNRQPNNIISETHVLDNNC